MFFYPNSSYHRCFTDEVHLKEIHLFASPEIVLQATFRNYQMPGHWHFCLITCTHKDLAEIIAMMPGSEAEPLREKLSGFYAQEKPQPCIINLKELYEYGLWIQSTMFCLEKINRRDKLHHTLDMVNDKELAKEISSFISCRLWNDPDCYAIVDYLPAVLLDRESQDVRHRTRHPESWAKYELPIRFTFYCHMLMKNIPEEDARLFTALTEEEVMTMAEQLLEQGKGIFFN